MNNQQKRTISKSLITLLSGTPVVGTAAVLTSAEAEAKTVQVPRWGGDLQVEQYSEHPSGWIFLQTSDVVKAAMESARSDFTDQYLNSHPLKIPQFARHTKTTGEFIEEIIDGVYGANGTNWESEGYFIQERDSLGINEFIFQIYDKERVVGRSSFGAAQSEGTARVTTHISTGDIKWLKEFFKEVDEWAKEEGLYEPMEVATDLSGVLAMLSALEGDYADLNDRLTGLEGLTDRVGTVEERFCGLLGKDYDGTTIMTLSCLYKGLEKTVDCLGQEYKGLSDAMDELREQIPEPTDLSSIYKRLTALETRIEGLDPTNLAGRMDELEGYAERVDKRSKERDAALLAALVYIGYREIQDREEAPEPTPGGLEGGETPGDDVTTGPIGRLADQQYPFATTERGGSGIYLGSIGLGALGRDLENLGVGFYQLQDGGIDLTLGYKTHYGFFYPKDKSLNVGFSIPF